MQVESSVRDFVDLKEDIDELASPESTFDKIVNYLSILKSFDGDNNLIKLAYLFKIEDEIMIEYASTFLDIEFVDILKNILKKPI